ncbi:hypothetical protein Hanom_Chr09g00767841 [Helianthus anomalus]
MFVHLTKQMKFLVRACSFTKRTNTNVLPIERCTNPSLNVRCTNPSLNVRSVCSPTKLYF